jgi:GT2 family glycosyltransferase
VPATVRGDQVTIVVLNWSRAADTVACLESLGAADLQGASVLVVDNGSRDGSVAILRARFPDLQVIALPENRGYAGGNNVGIQAALDAGAGAVLLLNNDTRVAPDFLPPLLEALNSSPLCAAVASAVIRADRPDMHDVAYSEVRFHERNVVQLRGVNVPVFGNFDRRCEVEVVVGCCALFRSEALRTVGVFDEAYFAYHEDVDWCLRARKAGWKLFYEPYARVYHQASASTARLHARPAPPPPLPWEPRLPNEEPPPWNPVRAYLGARNTVRLLRTYATPLDLKVFARRVFQSAPLEFTALVLGREGWLRLGRWSWGELARFYLLDRHRIPRDPPPGRWARIVRALRLAILVPVDLLWSAPRDIWQAVRTGRTMELFEKLRGVRDGMRDRPLPLKRLGLRG